MKFAVIQFPGSNCDLDMYEAIKSVLKEEVDYVDYRETNLEGYEAVLVPGGFTYGDYLRAGAIAARTPIMEVVKKKAQQGLPILGVCNGFQILTEAGLLPGSLSRNAGLHFVCRPQKVTIENNQTVFTRHYQQGEEVIFPIAHAEGNYYCDQETLEELEANDQIIFKYSEGQNPNGSVANIAGVSNKAGNVVGLMPHPERAVEAILGYVDGLRVFTSLQESLAEQKA